MVRGGALLVAVGKSRCVIGARRQIGGSTQGGFGKFSGVDAAGILVDGHRSP